MNDSHLRADGNLLVATGILVGIGMVAMYSATAPLSPQMTPPIFFARHCGGLVVAILCGLLAARMPLSFWQRSALPLWVLALALLVATLLLGTHVNGAVRWLSLPIVKIRFQPVELAKFASVLATAAVLAHGRRKRLRAWQPILLLTATPTALLLLQPDMGNAVLLAGTVGLLAFVAGAPLRLFTIPAAVMAAGLAAYITTQPYAAGRIIGFLDPWGTDRAQGFQLVQSFVAFGRGGMLGAGIGDGRQKLFYLPEAHTDFILAVVAEELGAIGVLVVFGAFAALAVAGVRIALGARDRFVQLLSFGMTALLVVPAVVNGAVVTGLMPTKGLSLPFLSYGRSALIASFVALGLLFRMARSNASTQMPVVSVTERCRKVVR